MTPTTPDPGAGGPARSFEELLREWAAAACKDWQYPDCSNEWHGSVLRRLPLGVQRLIAEGVAQGVIVPADGHKFTLLGLTPGKGPYAFFTRDEERRVAPDDWVLHANWEYFVQAAEYVRARSVLSAKGYKVGVEDRLMDVTVSSPDGRLVWYVEVKERADEAATLAQKVREHGVRGVNVEAPDRGRDDLRKAKYLIRYRPEYFSVSAIGMRLDFRMTYLDGDPPRFDANPDMVPFF